MRVRVAFLGMRDAQARQLATRVRDRGLEWFTLAPGARVPRPVDVDLLVVGPEAPRPLQDAQRWFQLDRTIRTAIVAHDRDVEGLRRESMTTPSISKDLLIVDQAAPPDWFVEAVRRTRAAKRHRLQMRRMTELAERANQLI